MRSRYFISWSAAGACTVLAVLFALSQSARHEQAYAQLVVPPVYDTDTGTDKPEQPMHKTVCKASKIIGMDVRTESGDEAIGSINDLMIRHDGRVAYAAVSFGGFLGMGDKLFAVPLEALHFVKIGEGADANVFARIDVSEQTLRDRKGFDQDNWPDEADQSFLTGADQQVGQRPGGDLSR